MMMLINAKIILPMRFRIYVQLVASSFGTQVNKPDFYCKNESDKTLCSRTKITAGLRTK